MNKYNWEGIKNFPSVKYDWENFEKHNVTALNVLYVKKEKVYPAYVSKQQKL